MITNFNSIGMDFNMGVVDFYGGTALMIQQPQTGAYLLLQANIYSEYSKYHSEYSKYQKAPEQFEKFTAGEISRIMRDLSPYLSQNYGGCTPIRVSTTLNSMHISYNKFKVWNGYLTEIDW